MYAWTFLDEIQYRITFIRSFFWCDEYFWQRSTQKCLYVHVPVDVCSIFTTIMSCVVGSIYIIPNCLVLLALTKLQTFFKNYRYLGMAMIYRYISKILIYWVWYVDIYLYRYLRCTICWCISIFFRYILVVTNSHF